MPVPLEQFVKHLEDSGILAGETLQDFIPPKASPKDAQDLARELVRQKKLTKFQAEAVYNGKGKSLVLDNYLMLEKIGQGGMGQVFKAEHRRMHRIVAVEILPTSLMKNAATVARFQREVRAAASIDHPNIVAAFDAGHDGGVHFLVMEYVEGSDLSALVKKNGPLPVQQAVHFILQAARGLEAAHKIGIVHRDIKPANLLVDKQGTVKILDMGLARLSGDRDSGQQADLTNTGTVMGTVDYMAPEQALDTKTADGRADIYSLGCSLFYLLTGRAAYAGNSLMQKLLAHREQPIPSLRAIRPEVPEQVAAVFSKMVAKNVADRYQAMSEVLADLDLEQWRSHQGPALSSPPSGGSQSDTGLSDFLTEISIRESPSVIAEKPAPSRDWPKNTKLLAIGSSVLGAVVLLAVLVISLRTKAGTPIVDSNEPPADRPARNESLRKDSRKRKRPRKEEGPTTGQSILGNVPSLSPDRDAAVFVLSLGGEVVLNFDYGHRIKRASALPKETFFVANIWLMENQKVTDKDLPRFKLCQGMWLIGLCGTKITDAGLAHIKEYATASGMSELYLGDTSITDSGLADLADCTGIRQLWIYNTAVTDDGLEHLKRMKQMVRLLATRTRVTEAGVEKLAAALPQCKIEWDGGVIEPKQGVDPE